MSTKQLKKTKVASDDDKGSSHSDTRVIPPLGKGKKLTPREERKERSPKVKKMTRRGKAGGALWLHHWG